MLETWLSGGFQRELGRLTADAQERIQDALRRFATGETVDVKPIAGSRYPGTIRVRVGPYRIVGTIMTARRLVYWTTLFRKRRPEDYRMALARHDARMHDNPGAPGPHNP